MTDRLSQMQKTLVSYQRKEQYAKKALYESQIKWTQFSSDIVRVCKELIEALEENKIAQYCPKTVDADTGAAASGQSNANKKQQVRLLPNVKDKIMKYDSFLHKNRQELSSKEFQQSMNP